ncbi:EscU/YscU/HrcU family type III secretion system export apparatus switch protein [Glaciecola sp. SC05]|uniref:EscU/YscU/HrcU family type III secretion system export apparatus switch protein n=1 Tax=Glaciecola sp. SC05 TaxID=1987355 RepID=UPI003529A047
MHSKGKSPQAVALQYQAMSPQGAGAPKVIAKGSGTLAQEMIALAEQHGIFVHQDEHLSQILSYLDLGQEIPESMYQVIAELIAFAFVLQGKFPENWHNVHQKIDFTE